MNGTCEPHRASVGAQQRRTSLATRANTCTGPDCPFLASLEDAASWLHLQVKPPWVLSLLLAAGKGRRADGRVLFLAQHPALYSPGECLRPAALVPQPASSTPKPSWAGLGSAPGAAGVLEALWAPTGLCWARLCCQLGSSPGRILPLCPSVVPVHGVAVPWGCRSH